MKWLLILWAFPVILLTGWYGLSYYDMNFGFVMLTRQAHDLVFAVYAQILGVPAETIPPLVARAMVFDSFVVFGIIGYRKRRELRAWSARRFPPAQPSSPAAASRASDASLSSAP